ncbi:hypothetical protein ONS95_000911 [Cadophora gregata]|uniref:uncharacterized protein n=1 Tax=Cadophora gregata TaxID=51156 RepID=UPI0026DB40C1|nr:uncharacterized protein ONS95_000911 [Cadophora gregata]KAK0102894.1 hypothetical protein ONS96_005522 [Cadophora gregata f. sp. sojae]KAK0128968.1 hypothetical protein ONS95_000911 [Cadophora gregata]
MKYAAAILALATGSIAASYGEYYPRNGTVYETITTTAITTYCPYPTEIVHNSKTYTVTKATTLTITDCPCTVTKAVLYPTASTVLYTSCPPGASSRSQAPYPEPPKPAPPTYSNPLTVVYPTPTEKKSEGVPVPTASYTPTMPTYPAEFTGAASANKISFIVGAAALAALAL